MIIYLLEDDEDLNFLIKTYLEKQGCNVYSYKNGSIFYENIIKIKKDLSIDAFVLDIMVPDLKGNEVIELIRDKFKDSFIVMTSALINEKIILECFKKGANDYLRKPFHLSELFYKIEQHRNQLEEKSKIDFGLWTLYPKELVCKNKDQSVKIDHKGVALLEYLIRNKNDWTTKETLLEKIWGVKNSKDMDTKRVEVCIARLRKKLGNSIIETSRNKGYKIHFHEQ